MRILFRLIAHLLESDDLDPALVIKPPILKYAGSDEGMRDRTAKRREAADKIRQRAAHVETGSKVADVLRMVK